MVADSLKLLPKESETKQRWTTEEWARQRSRLDIPNLDSEIPRAAVAPHEPMAGHASAAIDEPGRSLRCVTHGLCSMSLRVCSDCHNCTLP